MVLGCSVEPLKVRVASLTLFNKSILIASFEIDNYVKSFFKGMDASQAPSHLSVMITFFASPIEDVQPYRYPLLDCSQVDDVLHTIQRPSGEHRRHARFSKQQFQHS